MKLTPMKAPNPLATPPSPTTKVYDWIVQSGSYDQRPARLYLTARLPESSFPEPYEKFQSDVLIDIPPETTLENMTTFSDTGATMIQFFTMPRNNTSVGLCIGILVLSLLCALLYRNYAFAATGGMSFSLLCLTVMGGGANQETKTLQHYIQLLNSKKATSKRESA